MSSNEYMNKYMIERHKKRKQEFVNKLGGKCVKCGSVENLQFDHIDPKTKSFTICDSLSISKEKLEKELEKCQLLCSNCHENKTLKDLGQVSAKTTHGTVSSYRYCKCRLCKDAWNIVNKKYRSKKN